jgi:hypothetical protein
MVKVQDSLNVRPSKGGVDRQYSVCGSSLNLEVLKGGQGVVM